MRKTADAALFLPPLSLALTIPELGLPQLAAYLRARGRRVRDLDLNALFLSRFLKRPDARRLLRRRLSGAPAGVRLDERLTGTPWDEACTDGTQEVLDAYTAALGPALRSWDLGAVLEAARRPDPLYDLFFEEHVAPAAAGAALAGFSVLTHTQLPPALYFARRLKERFPGIRICLGGPWVTASLPAVKGWADLFSLADFLVFYEGEEALDGLLEHCRGRRPAAAVPNLAWLERGTVRFSPLRRGLPLARRPLPDFSSTDLTLYSRRALPYQASAGCEWGRCVFCYHCFPRNRFEAKTAERIVGDLAALKARYGVSFFWFADLSVPFETLGEVSGLLAERRVGVLWTALTRADGRYTPAFARRLYASGCSGLFFGLETSDPSALRQIRKGVTTEIFGRSVRACAAAGIPATAFVLNYPGQTGGEFRRTLAYLRGLGGAVKETVAARFELGRSSNTAARLGELGLELLPGHERDVRSFSLPYRELRRPGSALKALRAAPPRGGAGRAAAGPLLLMRPPSLRAAGAPADPGRRGFLQFLDSLGPQVAGLFPGDRRIMDLSAGGGGPGPALRCGDGRIKPTRVLGLSDEGLRLALRGLEPSRVLVFSGGVWDCGGAERLLGLCRGLFPGAPVTVFGPYATLCPERALAAGASAVFPGLFLRTSWRRGLLPGGPVRVGYGCGCGRPACPACALEGPVRRELPAAEVLTELAAAAARPGAIRLLGTAPLTAPSPALLSALTAFRPGARRFAELPEGLPCAALTPALAAALPRALRPGAALTLLPPPGGRLREALRRARALLAAGGFRPARAHVELVLGSPGQSEEEILAAAETIRACGFPVEPRPYAPLPGEMKRLPPDGLPGLNPWLWPFSHERLTSSRLDSLSRELRGHVI